MFRLIERIRESQREIARWQANCAKLAAKHDELLADLGRKEARIQELEAALLKSERMQLSRLAERDMAQKRLRELKFLIEEELNDV